MEMLDCKTAKLHLIQTIQPYGALVAIHKHTGQIVAYSENIQQFLNLERPPLIGESWRDLFENDSFPFEKISSAIVTGNIEFSECSLNGKQVNVVSHVIEDTVIAELEILLDEHELAHHEEIGFLRALAASKSPEDAAALLIQQIARISDFDRVMLYRFLPDWHGKVIAEENKPGVEGFLGLHFPAGDVPPNARSLYAVNMQRIIADVNASDVGVFTREDSPPLNFTHSQLRSVHPVHIQYLKNIGARSSFSVSIIVKGTLWGMVACHELSRPRYLGLSRRLRCEELSRIASLHMSGLVALEKEQRSRQFSIVRFAIENKLKDQSAEEVIRLYADMLLSVFAANGLWLKMNGGECVVGDIAKSNDLSALESWLGKLDKRAIYHRNSIASELDAYDSLVHFASGLLYLPLANEGFMLICRNEQNENIEWAGKEDSTQGDGEATNLTPRRSFEKWTEAVHGKSTYWQDIEIEMAAWMHHSLLNHLKLTDLEDLALNDGLTKLANRACFDKTLSEIISPNRLTSGNVALLMLDLDRFKPVNDLHGHLAGDELLVSVARRMKNTIRADDFVARFGGDEFAIILYHFSSVAEVEIVAKRIIENVQKTFALKNAEVSIGISIGIAFLPTQGSSAEDLVQHADEALYQAKSAGGNTFRYSSGFTL